MGASTDLPFVIAMDIQCKEVLVIYNDRRRPVKFTCFEDSSENYHSLVSAVERVFCDVLMAEEGSSNSEGPFYLQMESKQWGGVLIDITSETQIDDHSTLYLCRPKSRSKPTTSSFDANSASEKVYLFTDLFIIQ